MKNNIFDLSGQVALVAGGSSGLGLQFARAMANAGANVALVARRMDLLEENAKAISAEFGVEVYPHYIDLRDPDSVTACVKDVVAHFGKIDILVNAGGVGGSGDPALMTDEQWYYVVDTDLTGLFRLCREVARLSMIPNNYGRIVNVSSMHGFVSRKHVWTAPYCAAKGGVHMMTKALANDWGKYDITVNCIAPGLIDTGMIEMEEAALKEAMSIIPMKRMGQAEEVAGLASYLMSDIAGYVTRQVISINGGML